jgi:hypothetical protein
MDMIYGVKFKIYNFCFHINFKLILKVVFYNKSSNEEMNICCKHSYTFYTKALVTCARISEMEFAFGCNPRVQE